MIAGHQLAKKDIFGASDPYVRIDLNTLNGDQTIDSALTKTKKKTLNPVWEEEFIFRVSMIYYNLMSRYIQYVNETICSLLLG